MIYLQTINKYWNPGERSIKFDSKKSMLDFHRYIADEYCRLVKLSIDKQRFRSKWADLSPGYLAYKRSAGLSTNIWVATGELRDSIKVTYKSTGNMVVGFDKKRIHKGTKIKLYKLAYYLEYGTLRIPPRPLFRLVYQYMRKHITEFYNRYLKISHNKG